MINTVTIEDVENVLMAAAEEPGKLLAVHMTVSNDIVSSHMSCTPENIEFSTQDTMSICANGTELNIDLNECEIRHEVLKCDPDVEESIELEGDSWMVNIDFLS